MFWGSNSAVEPNPFWSYGLVLPAKQRKGDTRALHDSWTHLDWEWLLAQKLQKEEEDVKCPDKKATHLELE